MEFRIGINLGDVIEEGDLIYGDEVNIASPIQSECNVDTLYRSEFTLALLKDLGPLKSDRKVELKGKKYSLLVF